MAVPLSIRFEDSLLERLPRSARAAASTPSGLAQRLVDEGLRSREHPGIVFRDGPSGRRAALAVGPDVWEVVSAVRLTTVRGEAAVASVADEMSLPEPAVRAALDYYAEYPAEIDAEVDENDRAAERALAAWRARQRLLS
jgi:hypothetical protein